MCIMMSLLDTDAVHKNVFKPVLYIETTQILKLQKKEFRYTNIYNQESSDCRETSKELPI